MKENAIWWLFGTIDLVDEIPKDMHILTKDEYAMFTGRSYKSELKNEVFPRLTNAEKEKNNDS